VTETDNAEPKLFIYRDENQRMQIDLQLENPQPVMIRVYDISGKLIRHENWKMYNSHEIRNINLKEKGVYILNIAGQGVNLTSRIIN
jgi:hypothetical protein